MEGSLARGAQLDVWGSAIADEASMTVWRGARRRWASATTRLLASEFEAEAVAEFARAIDLRGGQTWQERLQVELAATRNGLELLRLLAGTLRG
jgi:hypothetical protein